MLTVPCNELVADAANKKRLEGITAGVRVLFAGRALHSLRHRAF